MVEILQHEAAAIEVTYECSFTSSSIFLQLFKCFVLERCRVGCVLLLSVEDRVTHGSHCTVKCDGLQVFCVPNEVSV